MLQLTVQSANSPSESIPDASAHGGTINESNFTPSTYAYGTDVDERTNDSAHWHSLNGADVDAANDVASVCATNASSVAGAE